MTGYVLISHVDVAQVILPKLQIIRGRTLFKLPVSDVSFALMVMLSKMNTLEMPALRGKLSFQTRLAFFITKMHHGSDKKATD